MELTNEFRVGLPVDKAWVVLTDLERIAPCMPGAELQEVEGDEYRGVVKVKVGPITAQYKGKANWVERDAAAHRAVARAEGRETRGQGNASATITATLTPDGDGTRVDVVTDLTITGRVASFGRGVLADVSAKLLQQFVDSLEADLSREGNDDPDVRLPPAAGAEAAGAASDAAPAVRRIESRPAQPVDLTEAAGPAVAKRVAPFVAGLFLLYWLVRRRRRRRG
ncbi:MAG: carbon monoxide dehydrogenase [Actinobacteria bacterium]|nr:MAG: carbon monoxide dehydrogenase [Actinomycetota bacterium]